MPSATSPHPPCPGRPYPKTEGKLEGEGGSARQAKPASATLLSPPPGRPAPRPGEPQSAAGEACGWGGRGGRTLPPGGPPPRPACDWLGGRVCPPRRGGEGPLGAPGGRRRRTGRRELGPQGASEGRASRVPEIREQASRGAESGGRANGEGKPGGLRAAARCSALSRDRQPARPRSLPGGSGAGSGPGARSGSLTCRRPAAPPAGRAQAGRGGGEKTGRPRRSPAARERLGARAGHRLHGDRARGAGLRTFGRRGERRPLPAWDSPGSSCPAPAGSGYWADPRGARPPRLRRNPKRGCAGWLGPDWGLVLGPICPALAPPQPPAECIVCKLSGATPFEPGFARPLPPALGVGGGRVRLCSPLIPLLSQPRLPGSWATFRLSPLQPGSP